MFAVLIPVGPDAREPRRLGHLLTELARYEDPARIELVIVDDAPPGRDLGSDWPGARVIRTVAWSSEAPPDPLSAHVTGTLEGLRAAGDVDFALKLDTDAAIIGPFSAALSAAFSDPGLGVVGSFDRTADGGLRDFSHWKGPITRAAWPVYRDASGTFHTRSRVDQRRVRSVLAKARPAGPLGAHCLGGAYAVSRAFLSAADLCLGPWPRTRLGEDVVIGLLCREAGLDMRSLTARGEPFALSWRGLPASPQELRRGGYRIVHSVKRTSDAEEDRLRAELQSVR